MVDSVCTTWPARPETILGARKTHQCSAVASQAGYPARNNYEFSGDARVPSVPEDLLTFMASIHPPCSVEELATSWLQGTAECRPRVCGSLIIIIASTCCLRVNTRSPSHQLQIVQACTEQRLQPCAYKTVDMFGGAHTCGTRRWITASRSLRAGLLHAMCIAMGGLVVGYQACVHERIH